MEMIEFLKDLQPTVAQQNLYMGWRDKPRTFAQDIILIGEELGEATTGLRKGVMDTKLPTYPMIAVELADLIIRGLDTLSILGAEWPNKLEASYPHKMYMSERLAFMHVLLGDAYLHRGNEVSAYQIQRLVVVAYEALEERGFPAQRIIKEKMEFNLTRPDHTREARQQEGGKSW